MLHVTEVIVMCSHSQDSPTDEFLEEIQHAYRQVVSPEKIQGNTLEGARLWSNRNVCLTYLSPALQLQHI